MNLIISFLKGIGILALVGAFNETVKFFWPPKPDSWQTLIWISVMSWGFSLVAYSPTIQIVIACCAWIFLIAGLHWAMHGKAISARLKFNGFFIGPWITGALICLFLWSLLNNSFPQSETILFLVWAPLSAAIAAAPKFIKGSNDGAIPIVPAPPVRQEVIILILSNLIISCWFQLYFATETWLNQYPTLRCSDLSRSAFVYRLPSDACLPERGVLLLENSETVVQQQLTNASWAQVERWLLDVNQKLPEVRYAALNKMTPTEEDALWGLEGTVTPGNGYALELRSVWLGPTADGVPFYLRKTCEISQAPAAKAPISLIPNFGVNSAAPPAAIAIDCESVEGPVKVESTDIRL